jgi:hypothetical protein
MTWQLLLYSTEARARAEIAPAEKAEQGAIADVEAAELKMQQIEDPASLDKAEMALHQLKAEAKGKSKLLAAAKTTELQRHKIASNALKFCHNTKWAASLPGNGLLHPVQQGRLLLPRGWTVFHELASGSQEVSYYIPPGPESPKRVQKGCCNE